MQEHTKDSRKIIPVIILILLGVIAIGALIMAVSSNSNTHTDSSKLNAKNTADPQENKTGLTGVLKEIDTENMSVTILDIKSGRDVILSYHGGTNFQNKHGEELTADNLIPGEIIDAYFDAGAHKLSLVQKSKQAWEYTNVTKYKVDRSGGCIQIGDRTYAFKEPLVIADQDKLINFIDLTDRDKLTVSGIGKEIYSLIVTKGHGYIRFRNHEQFAGGLVQIGNGQVVPVTEDMLITAAEGKYQVTIQKGEMVGRKNINIVRNEEVVADMSEFEITKPEMAKVNFEILPLGAELSIDGRQTDYSEPVQLAYGMHLIKVSLEGYNEYSGIIRIEEPERTVKIDLAEIEKEEGEDNPDDDGDNKNPASPSPSFGNAGSGASASPSSSPLASPSPSASTIPEKVDKKHNIVVKKPTGADVYFDGVKMGTSPISFTKKTGSHIISFSRSGYETKSYSIDIPDDDSDYIVNLPEMSKIGRDL